MTYGTYILIGRTNPYQAQRSGLFRGRTLIAVDYYYYMSKLEASDKLMDLCIQESDNYGYNDDGTAVQEWISGDIDDGTAKYDAIMERGDLSYHYDGYDWAMVPVDELDYDEARAALRYGLNNADTQMIYDRFPDLAPVVEADEE